MTDATPEKQPITLLPRPFCGSQPFTREFKASDESDETYGFHEVQCPQCRGAFNDGRFCGVHGATPEKAAQAWNTRTLSAPGDAEREEMAKRLENGESNFGVLLPGDLGKAAQLLRRPVEPVVDIPSIIRGAKLPEGYFWGREAMEHFNFAKECAAREVEAALNVSQPGVK